MAFGGTHRVPKTTIDQISLDFQERDLCMSYSLNSFKGGYTGDDIGDSTGVIKGATSS